MNYFDWVTLALAVALVVLVALSFTDRFARRSLRYLPGTGGGLPPESLRPSLTRRLMVQMRVSTVCGLAALVGAYVALRLGSSGEAFADGYAALAAAGTGLGLGLAISSVSQQLRQPDTSIRLARLRVARINDYVSVWSRILGWILVAMAVAIVVLLDQQALDGVASRSTWSELLPSNIIALLAVIGLALFEIASRAIVARPQPAATSEELVWEDALRASTLRDLLQGPVLFGVYGLLFLAFRRQDWDNSGRNVALFLLLAGVIICFFVSLLILRETRERYLYRLWPNGPTEREDLEVVDVEGVGHAR